MIGGVEGRQFGDGFRAETEVLYLHSNGKLATDSDLETIAGMVNGYYDFNRNGAWRPFVGAGVGVAQVKVDGGFSRGDDTGFAYQFKAGVAHPITDRLTGEVAYRYLGVNGVQFGEGTGRLNGNFSAHLLTVGL